MGSVKDNPHVQTYGVKINKTCIKTLGVYTGHDKEITGLNVSLIWKNYLSRGKLETLQFLENAVSLIL